MNASPPLQCKCGLTAFVDIRFRDDGVMTFTCFQCRTPMQINAPAMMVWQAWETAQLVAPEPTTPITPTTPTTPEQPERPERYGYKLGGLL